MQNSIIELYIADIDRYLQTKTGLYNEEAKLLKRALLQVESIDSLQEQLNCLNLSYRLTQFYPPADPFETILCKIQTEIDHRKQLHAACQEIRISFDNQAAIHLISLINSTLSNPLTLLHSDFLSLNRYLTDESQLHTLITLMISLSVDEPVSRARSGSFFEKLAHCTDVKVSCCNTLLRRVATAISKIDREDVVAVDEERNALLGQCNGLLQKLLRIYLDTHQLSPVTEKRDSCVLL